jgi:hypothetical protein
LDVTNTRNYRVGYTGHFGASSRFILRDLPAVNKILVADDFALDQTSFSSIEDTNSSFWKVATVDAVDRDGKKVQPLATAGAAIYAPSPNCLAYRNVGADSRIYGQFDTYTLSGNLKCIGPSVTEWSSGATKVASFVQDYIFSTQQLIQPTSTNWSGYLYQYVVGGVTDVAEPSWPTSAAQITQITAITQANPAVVTANGHGLTNGQFVYLAGIGGMTQVNNLKFTVAGAAANTFQLSGINSGAYSAFTSGGTAQQCLQDGTAYFVGPLANAYLASESLRAETWEFGLRRFIAPSNVAPTVGRFGQSDQTINRLPDAAGGTDPFIGWVCTNGGVPGTWHKFGATF